MVQATAHVQLDTDRVVVTEWRFDPGAETGSHIHKRDYVVVPLTSGTLQMEVDGASSASALEYGVSYARNAGVEHNVLNLNDFEFRFIEIELK
ncbi:MAG: cupin domain-containing protein [Acidimicrobiales bacterium]